MLPSNCLVGICLLGKEQRPGGDSRRGLRYLSLKGHPPKDQKPASWGGRTLHASHLQSLGSEWSLVSRPLGHVAGPEATVTSPRPFPAGLGGQPSLGSDPGWLSLGVSGETQHHGPSFVKAGRTLPRTHTLQRSSVTLSMEGDRLRLEARCQWGLPSPDPLIWAPEPLGEKEEWAAHWLRHPHEDVAGAGRSLQGLDSAWTTSPWPCNVGTETGVLASLPTLLFTCCVTSDHSLNLSGLSFPHL